MILQKYAKDPARSRECQPLTPRGQVIKVATPEESAELEAFQKAQEQNCNERFEMGNLAADIQYKLLKSLNECIEGDVMDVEESARTFFHIMNTGGY